MIDVLDLVRLGDAARRRTGGFSLGMSQRLGIAAALLGDPPIVILDEPVNGLDPDGVQWVRNLVKSPASEGRTVFLSSHLMSEMAVTADRLLVIGRGIIVRSSAGAIATLFGILFVPSILVSVLPQAWQTTIGPYLPMEAGSAIFIANNHGSANLGPWTGFAVFCAYALVSLVAGFLIVCHRDV